MLKRFIYGIVYEIIHEEMECVIYELISLRKMLEDNNILISKINEEHARSTETQTQNQAQNPIGATRPSWMRMKKHLEEEDIRRLLYENSPDSETAKRFNKFNFNFNKEADRVGQYWKEKAAQNRDL